MESIKDRRAIILQNYNTFVKNLNPELSPQQSADEIINYQSTILFPQLKQLTDECSTIGHVNLETISREDGSNYYSCDNCKLIVELRT